MKVRRQPAFSDPLRVVAGDASHEATGGIIEAGCACVVDRPARTAERELIAARLASGVDEALEGRLGPSGARDVRGQREFAAQESWPVEAAIVVDDRSGDRYLLLPVGVRQATEIIGPGIEEAALALAGQVNRRNAFPETGPVERIEIADIVFVVLVEPLVGGGVNVPAVLPLVVDQELAGRIDGTAKILVSGAVGRLRGRLPCPAGKCRPRVCCSCRSPGDGATPPVQASLAGSAKWA